MHAPGIGFNLKNQMRKIYLLALMAILMPFLASAQFTISGRVINQANQQNLAGASVTIDELTIQTDASGTFRINNLTPDVHTVSVSYVGFKPFSEKVKLTKNTSLLIELQSLSVSMDEVIVKSTRASSNTPTTFKNLTKEDLEKNNLGQDLPYLLNQTPSVVVSSDAGTGIGYTGIRIRGSDPTRVNVTINGIPYNDPESQGTYFVDIPDFASSVNNIQIQRGVGTSTNGAGAFGGSLNIQTTTRNDSSYVELNNAGGSYNTLKHTLNFGTGLLDGKFTLDGRLSKISSDGYIDRGAANLKSFFFSGAYYGKNSSLRANVFSGKETTYQAWNGVPEAKLKGSSEDLLTHYYNNVGNFYFNESDSSSLWNSNSRTYNMFNYPGQNDNYSQDHYQLIYARNISSKLTFNGALHYTYGHGYWEEYKYGQKFSKYGLDPVTVGTSTVSRTDLIRRRWLKNDFYGLTYSLNYRHDDKLDLTFGGAYNEYDGNHYGEIVWAQYASNSTIGQHYYDGTGFKTDFNIYGRANYQLDQLNLFADLQYRGVNYTIGGTDKNRMALNQNDHLNFFNPKVGLTYSLDDKSNVYASLAVANKEPNRDDYVNSTLATRPKSENLNDVEAGYRLAENNYALGLNVFGMIYKNQLVLTGKVSDAGEPIRQNVAKSYRAGVELDGSWRISSAFTWRATAALSRNRVKDFTEVIYIYDNNFDVAGQQDNNYRNSRIAYSPSFVASNEFTVKPTAKTEIALLSKYVSRQFLDNTANTSRMLDAYFVNDVRLRYNTNFKGVKNLGLTLLINNAFNELYENNGYTYSSLFGTQLVTENFYFPQAERNVLVGVSVRF